MYTTSYHWFLLEASSFVYIIFGADLFTDGLGGSSVNFGEGNSL